MGSNYTESEETRKRIEEDSEEEEEIEVDWGDWKEDDKEDEDDGLESGFLCLFCDAKYSSCDELFEHCRLSHYFDFDSIRTGLSLDFYASFKLINYVRSQVSIDYFDWFLLSFIENDNFKFLFTFHLA